MFTLEYAAYVKIACDSLVHDPAFFCVRNLSGWFGMSGRGADIRLAPGVAEIGGLHVLATERHDAGRIDRQLFGRGGRQGDQGSFQAIVSLEDEIVHDIFKGYAARLCRLLGQGGKPLPPWLGGLLVSVAQQIAERHHARVRSDFLRIDDQLSDLLAFTGQPE